MNPTREPSTSTNSTPPSSPPSPNGRPIVHAEDVAQGILGYRVVSGTGEELGRVLGLHVGADGRPRKISFVEHDGDEPRFVPLRFIRGIERGEVRLAGPRDGYHMTRVRSRTMPTMGEES